MGVPIMRPSSLSKIASLAVAGSIVAAALSPSLVAANISFDLLFPAGYGLSQVTVGASEDMVLGPGVKVEGVDGSLGIVTNAGSGQLGVGPKAAAGSLVSTGSIRLGPNVTANSVRSATTIELSPGDVVANVEQRATLTPLVQRTMTVPSLSGTPSDVSVKPGASITLSPGRYGAVTIGSHAAVTVSAGIYLIDDFTLGPRAELHLDTSGGTVNIYVNRSVRWKGEVFGDGARFIFGFLGQGAMVLEGGFLGTALAPFGTLELKPPSAYQGTFYAKHVVIGPQITVQKLPTPMLIDGVTVSNTTPCTGEPVEVLVSLGAGNTLPGATTWIQGVVGTRQFVQFRDAPGERTVFATVTTPDGRADFTSVPVTVQRCDPPPGAGSPIALHFWPALRKPNIVELVVHDYDANGHEVAASGSATYAWSFGDGQSLTTSAPFVSHDYTAAIDPMAQYNYFEVSVTVTKGTGPATAKKVVPIWSLYAKNRAKGIIQPPNTVSVSTSNLAVVVTNHESTPISITQANLELLPCDPALDALPQNPQALSVTVGAGATATVNVGLPASIASDVCGVGVHLLGSGAAGRVYTDAYTRLKENARLVQAVTDADTIALLDQASALTKDPDQFDEFELRGLYAQGSIPQLPLGEPAPAKLATLRRALGLDAGDPTVGAPCTPGDTSPLGLVCGPTKGWVFVGPEFLNAFKGNFIMDHGCGKIGQLLGAVHQLFSHTSTIVKNRVEVRHSTASSDRMNSNVDYLAERLDPDTLQQGYPGTAGPDQTYTIDQMVNEYFVTDPYDAGKTWRMGGELNPNPAKCANDTTAVLPVVIRPAPDAPASVLQAVASVVDHTNINSHYRFFNYTRADQLLPGAGWAAGTESTVCSSFDWLAAVRAGLTLRPTLKQPGVPDGMREYKVEERTMAGNALYAQVANDVGEACNPTLLGAVVGGAGYLLGGPIGGVIGGVVGSGYCKRMIDNIANQVNNCFANDGCADTGDRWRNPGMGVAVSPDDILEWDTWHDGGTYGYNEPLVYQPKGYRRAYAWAAAPGSGSMTVKVVHATDNTPYANATVLLNTNPVGTTDDNGVLTIPTLAAGTYEVGAQFDRCATEGHPDNCTTPLEQANIVATLPQDGSITVTLTLCAGPTVNGVVTSCPQPGAGPRFTHVGIEFGPEKYLLCILGAGFEPDGPPADVTLSGPGGFFKGPLPGTGIDAGGGLFTSTVIERVFNSGFDCSGQVTVTAVDKLADVAVQTTVPAAYWCTNGPTLPNFNGGCQP